MSTTATIVGNGKYTYEVREDWAKLDQDGKLLRIWPTKLIGPAVFYVDRDDVVYIPEHNGGLMSVLTLEGERLAQWGDPSFRSVHSMWGDSRGDLYVVRPGTTVRTPRRIVKHVRVG